MCAAFNIYTIKVMFSRKSHFRIIHLTSFITSKYRYMDIFCLYVQNNYGEEAFLFQVAQLTLLMEYQASVAI